MRILLIEDEKRMAQALCEILRQEKYEVDHCPDGISGSAAAESGLYDLIILDVMLPGKDGFAILEDKVAGLDGGADDYLTKPFLMQELLARLRALTRRNINSADGSLSFGDITLDIGTATLGCSSTGQSVRLSEKEYRILEYLIANQGRILAREQLAVKIWGYENEAEYNNVEVYMSFTRKKLAYVGARTTIKAVRGIGYELRCTDV